MFDKYGLDKDSQASTCNTAAFHQEEAIIQSTAGATDAAKRAEEGRRVVLVAAVGGVKKKQISSTVVICSLVSCAPDVKRTKQMRFVDFFSRVDKRP